MYLNVNFSQSSDPSSVPRTPEILSLLTGAPLDHHINFSGLIQNPELNAREEDSNPSWNSSELSLDAPVASSVNNTKTFLVKEGLKLTIQKKRLTNGRHLPVESDHSESKNHIIDELTPEDEERRRRRRERNKVAATKCRNRKKEKTGLLLKESDILEAQNFNMKNEIQNLEKEKQRLNNILSKHSPSCVKTGSAENSPYMETCPPYFPQNSSAVDGRYSSSVPWSYGTNGEIASNFPSQSSSERNSISSNRSTNSFSSSSLTDYYDGSSMDSTLQTLQMTFHQL